METGSRGNRGFANQWARRGYFWESGDLAGFVPALPGPAGPALPGPAGPALPRAAAEGHARSSELYRLA